MTEILIFDRYERSHDMEGILENKYAKALLFLALLALFIFASESISLASDGDSLPWNSGLDKLTKALSGKTALMVSMVGVFFAGGMLLFGGDLGGFGKTIMMVVLVGSMLGGLNAVVTAFITTGALLAL